MFYIISIKTLKNEMIFFNMPLKVTKLWVTRSQLVRIKHFVEELTLREEEACSLC